VKRRGFLKYVVIAGCVLAALSATCVVSLHVVFSPSRMKSAAIARMEDLLDRKVEIGTLSFTLCPFFGIRAGDIRVMNRGGEGLDAKPFVSTGECVVALKFPPLLKRLLVVDRVVVKSAMVMPGGGDTVNVAEMSVTFNDLCVRAGDLAANAKGPVRGFGPKAQKVDLSVTTDRIKFSGPAALTTFPGEISGLDGKIAFTGQGCSIDTLRFDMGKNPASLSGTVTGFRAPHVDLTLDMQINPQGPADTISLPGGVELCGTGDLRCRIVTSGDTTESLPDRLGGTLSMTLENGLILYAPLLRNMARELAKYYSIDRMEFDRLELESRMADRSFWFERPVRMVTRKSGDWQITGSVGFDATLALSVKNRLTKSVSQSVISTQNRGKDILRGLLGKTRFAGAADLLEEVTVPVDETGRITVLLDVKGPAADPKVSFRGFESKSGL